jgi:LmbE family N-acetylglucosaminyl deacetylase
VSATLERKIAALRAHASQIKDPGGLAERIRTWALEEGATIGVGAAEALRLVVIDDDEDEGPG